jgi:hypothetical protein
MSHTLVEVGNSKAIIIPARIIRKRRYTSKTEFDIIETNDGLRLVHKYPSLDSLEFVKVKRPPLSAKVKELKGSVRISPEEMEGDERLGYILSR